MRAAVYTRGWVNAGGAKKNLRPEATDTVNAPTPEGAEIVGHVRGALGPRWAGEEGGKSVSLTGTSLAKPKGPPKQSVA